MNARLPIGDFSKMTYLSVKALRRYHDMGLLVPAAVDPATGYRYYVAAQVPAGQVIRRFRDLGMPLGQIKEVLGASDSGVRNELIVAHLRRMEEALEQTQRTVASLRSLLEQALPGPIAVEYRTVPDTWALAITEPVAMADIEAWWGAAFDELHRIVCCVPGDRCGPDGALYPSEFFQDERGEVTVFLPVAGQSRPSGRAQLVQIPGAELAVTVHEGPFTELDRAYGALGTFVAQREIAVEGPIREHYLVINEDTDDDSQHRTEVCWPVFHTREDGAQRSGHESEI
jgi:DNA-binding transcriptional MerR regulator/effector-binding domain-containing protein